MNEIQNSQNIVLNYTIQFWPDFRGKAAEMPRTKILIKKNPAGKVCRLDFFMQKKLLFPQRDYPFKNTK